MLTTKEAARGFREAAEYIEKYGLARDSYFETEDPLSIILGEPIPPKENCPACALGAFCKAMDYPDGDYTWEELDKLMSTLDEYPSFRGKGFSTPGKIADFSDLSSKEDVIDMLNYLSEWFAER